MRDVAERLHTVDEFGPDRPQHRFATVDLGGERGVESAVALGAVEVDPHGAQRDDVGDDLGEFGVQIDLRALHGEMVRPPGRIAHDAVVVVGGEKHQRLVAVDEVRHPGQR